MDSAGSLKQRPAVAVETVIVGVSVVVTPMKATLTSLGAVPTVLTSNGASAKSGVSQPAVAQLPVSFLTMFAVTYG